MEMEWYRLVIFGVAMFYSGYITGRFIAENKAAKEIRDLERELKVTNIVQHIAIRDNC